MADSQGWEEFIDELEQEILPLYHAHEQNFDLAGIHGRMHICRAVIFAEWMARRAESVLQEPLDRYAIRVAIAFHDSGREGNGVDLWEEQSAENCRLYLSERSPYQERYPAGKAAAAAGWILKHGDFDLPQRIVYDADVLEIMRPVCGHGGLKGFQPDYLHFGGSKDPLNSLFADAPLLREALIQEAWKWIVATEPLKMILSSSGAYMHFLLTFLTRHQASYPLLAEILS